jgi:hypothetical protein
MGTGGHADLDRPEPDASSVFFGACGIALAAAPSAAVPRRRALEPALGTTAVWLFLEGWGFPRARGCCFCRLSVGGAALHVPATSRTQIVATSRSAAEAAGKERRGLMSRASSTMSVVGEGKGGPAALPPSSEVSWGFQKK